MNLEQLKIQSQMATFVGYLLLTYTQSTIVLQATKAATESLYNLTYLSQMILLMFILKWFSKKENRRGFLNNHFYKFYITFIVVFLGMTIVSIYSLQVRFVIAMTMNIILSEVYDMLRDVIQNDILIRDELTSYNQNRRFYKQTGGMIGFVLSLVIKEFGLVKDIEMYLILDFISFMICITPLPYWYEYWKKNTDK